MIFSDYQSFVMLSPLFAAFTLIVLIAAGLSNQVAHTYPSVNMLIQSIFFAIGILWIIEWVIGVYRTILAMGENSHVLPSQSGVIAWVMFIEVYLGPIVFFLIAASLFTQALRLVHRP